MTDTPDPPTRATAAAHGYVYGVAHIDNARLSRYQPHRTRKDAEKDLQACLTDEADCYLVRASVSPWEKVPDGA